MTDAADALHPCQRRPHYGEPCECEARLAAVVSHHVVDDPDIGPPFCQECSEAISEYVPWDETHQARLNAAENDTVLAGFMETWPAYQKKVDTRYLNTDIVREGWSKPTLYREHEAIHVLCNVIDNLRSELRNLRDE